MSKPLSPRRAEHLGSLLRPIALLDALNTDTDLQTQEEILNREIKIIVQDQLALGLNVINDGEYRRSLFWGSFFGTLQGFESVPLVASDLRTYLPKVTALLEYGMPTTLRCTSKIRHSGQSPHLQEFLYLKSIVPSDRVEDIKITIPAPHWYHLQYKQGSAYADGMYASDEEYFQDIATAYQTELKILHDAGLRRVQIDDPDLSYFCSEDVTKAWAADPTNTKSPTQTLASYVELYNNCFANVNSKMHIGIHVCRGNFTDCRYWSAGGYDAIARQIFQDLNVNTFYLEFDSPRAGGFEPLQYLPLEKNVILGVVSTKSADLEDLDQLRDRVMQAAGYISKGNSISIEESLKRLGVSPQCGFASHSRENRLTKEDMLEKLKLVKRLADSIWPNEV